MSRKNSDSLEQILIRAIVSEDILKIHSLLMTMPKRLINIGNKRSNDKFVISNTKLNIINEASNSRGKIQIYKWKSFYLNSNKDNALHYTCRLGKCKLIKILLDSGYFDINEGNADGDTALHISIDCGWIETAHRLISYGADINCENNKHKTPLILATELIMPYDTQMCTLLIEKNANINKQTRNGNSVLLSASKFGNFELIKNFAYLNANLNLKFHDGATVLMRACYYNYIDIVKFLLNHGAKVDDANNRHETSLYIAAFRGNYEVVCKLIEYGANVNSEDRDGDTPLTVACYEDRSNIISFLLHNGANVNKQGIRGDSPLHIASSNCSLNVVNELLMNGAFVDLLNYDQETPLHIASKQNRLDICNLLLEYARLLDRESRFGKSPLKNVIENLHPVKINLARRLIQCGCDINKMKFRISELTSRIQILSIFYNDLTLLEYLILISESVFKTIADKNQLINFINLLFDAGYKFNYQKDYNLLKSSATWLFSSKKGEVKKMNLLFRMRNPESLTQLCRHRVRKLINKPLINSIKTLHIPFILKDYLCLK